MLDAKQYYDLLNLTSLDFKRDIKILESILDKYPYFQSARVLQLSLFKQLNSPQYNQTLKNVAAHTTDRDVLFNFVSSKVFRNKSNEMLTQSSYPEIKEVIDSTTNEEIHLTENFNEKKEPEEILELNKPLNFNKDDKHSFKEWLKLTQKKKIQRNLDPKQVVISINHEKISDSKTNNTEKVINLVDEFLKNRPRPSRKTSTSEERELKLEAYKNEAPQSLMTETLARVYVQQKNYNKAIQAYKILILKNPEKSGYFADKIRAIEKILNKN